MSGPRTVRGSHVRQAQRWVDRHLGEGSFDAIVREHDPTWPTEISVRLAYPVMPMIHAVRAAAERLDVLPFEAFKDICEANAREDLNSIYRAFLWVASPVMLLAATQMLWTTYVDFGKARVISNQRGHYRGEIFELPNDIHDWSESTWQGFIPAAIEMAGGQDVRMTTTVLTGAGEEPRSRVHCEIFYS